PPPCIYIFPATIPQPRTNPCPAAQSIDGVHFLKALHQCFKGSNAELNFVDFEVEYQGADIVRKTRIRRGAETVRESAATAIRRTSVFPICLNARSEQNPSHHSRHTS